MSIGTTGGQQRSPSAVSSGRKAAAGRPPRRRVTPVRVQAGRNWGLIALVATVVTVAVGIIGYGGWAVYQDGRSWQDRAADIDGLVNFRERTRRP
jgi:hypothetical protein